MTGHSREAGREDEMGERYEHIEAEIRAEEFFNRLLTSRDNTIAELGASNARLITANEELEAKLAEANEELGHYKRLVNRSIPDHLMGRHDKQPGDQCLMCQRNALADDVVRLEAKLEREAEQHNAVRQQMVKLMTQRDAARDEVTRSRNALAVKHHAEDAVVEAAKEVVDSWRVNGIRPSIMTYIRALAHAVDALAAADSSSQASAARTGETGPDGEASGRICSICDGPVVHAQELHERILASSGTWMAVLKAARVWRADMYSEDALAGLQDAVDAMAAMDAADSSSQASAAGGGETGPDGEATWEVRCGADLIFSGSEEDCDRWIANARHWDEEHGLPFERHGMHKVHADSRAGQAGEEVAHDA